MLPDWLENDTNTMLSTKCKSKARIFQEDLRKIKVPITVIKGLLSRYFRVRFAL